MPRLITFHLAQIDPTVGAVHENARKILDHYKGAVQTGSDCVIFPELAIVGYPPQDLLLLKHFIAENRKALDWIAERISEVPAIIGFVNQENNRLYSAAAVLKNGMVESVVHKRLLPTYDVFDEDRYFTEGVESIPVSIDVKGATIKLGVHVCEDLWDNIHDVQVVDELASAGADVFINLSASPFYSAKWKERVELAREKSEKYRKPFLYCNMVGGQDELVFDGNSFALDNKGNLTHRAPAFEESLFPVVLDLENGYRKQVIVRDVSREEEIFRALVYGLKEYCAKSGFDSVVLGMSGGVDSSLVAVIAAEALGAENVYGISMPSHYSSDHSKSDARKLAKNLGIHFNTIAIHETFESYNQMMQEPFEGLESDVTEENLQARIRGNILMAYSNKFGHLVLSTGNKTELALGYCTLYGDMTGGLAVISDVNKMDIYGLCRWYNKYHDREIVPDNVLTKPPSAELKADQQDPFDYEVVSPLVEEIVAGHKSVPQLIEQGYDAELVREMVQKVRRAEYKRRQAAPGLKVTRKSFGSGRRMPIINHFKEEELF